MEAGEQHTQTAYLCLLSLIRAQLAGSRGRLWSCSHMPTVMIQPRALMLLFALFCHSFLLFYFFVTLTFPPDISWHTKRVRYYSDHILQALTHGSLTWDGNRGMLEETMTGGGERRRGDVRDGNELIWVSNSSRNYHPQKPCRQCVEPAEQNRSQVVWEMNL